MRRELPIGIILASMLVIVACFMPWGTVQGALTLFGQEFGDEKLTVEVTDWNSYLTLHGIKIPNWTVAIAAAAIAVLVIAKVAGAYSDKYTVLLLAIYGIIHTGCFTLIVAFNGSLGIGSVLAAMAFLVIFSGHLKHISSQRATARTHQELTL